MRLASILCAEAPGAWTRCAPRRKAVALTTTLMRRPAIVCWLLAGVVGGGREGTGTDADAEGDACGEGLVIPTSVLSTPPQFVSLGRGFTARPRQASVLALPPQIALPSVPAYLPPPCSHRSSARSLAVWLHVRFTVAHGNRPPGVRCPLPRQTSPRPAPPVPPLSHGSLIPLRPSLPLCLRTLGGGPFLRPLRARSHRSRLHYHRAIRLCGCMQNSNLHRILSLGPC